MKSIRINARKALSALRHFKNEFADTLVAKRSNYWNSQVEKIIKELEREQTEATTAQQTRLTNFFQ